MIFNKVKTLSDKMIDTHIIHGFFGGVNRFSSAKTNLFSTEKLHPRARVILSEAKRGALAPALKDDTRNSAASSGAAEWWDYSIVMVPSVQTTFVTGPCLFQ